MSTATVTSDPPGSPDRSTTRTRRPVPRHETRPVYGRRHCDETDQQPGPPRHRLLSGPDERCPQPPPSPRPPHQPHPAPTRQPPHPATTAAGTPTDEAAAPPTAAPPSRPAPPYNNRSAT